MEHPQPISNETKHQLFCITKDIEANEHKLKVLQTESEKFPKAEAELESDAYKQRTQEEKQYERSLERKLEISERDELLSMYEEQKIILEQAGEWIKRLQDFKGKYYVAQKEKAEVVQQKDALQIQLKVALTERDDLKISNEEMSCRIKLLEKQLQVVESERTKLKGEIVHAKKRSAAQEELMIKVKRSRTDLCEQLEASESNLRISKAENNLLNENIRLLKQQVSLMQNAFEPQHLKSERDINNLPLEMLDMILRKSYLFCSMGTHGSTQSRDKAIIRKVASVDFCWFQMTKKRRFKRTIWRHLEVFYRNIGAGNTICRSSRSYLQQVVGSVDINCLKSIEYPSDVQARQRRLRNSHKLKNTNSKPSNMNSEETLLVRFKKLWHALRYEVMISRPQKKNSQVEFLHDIRFFDETRYSSMINCLRQAKLMSSARLAENGGVAVKVEVLHIDDIRFSERLVIGLNKLKDSTRPRHRSIGVEHFIRGLKRRDIEILDSFHQRRHADIWIWCKSKAGLAILHKLYKSCKLKRVLSYLTNVRSSGFRCNIDKDQFKKEIVSRSVAIKLIQELDLQGRERDHIVAVAKLPGKILVICLSTQTVIQVFQDQNPFSLQKTTEHNEILWPVDIVSCELQKCIYISDKGSKCIWKIISKTDGSYEVTKWCNARFPFTMSMCNDGRLVVVGNEYIGPVLEIYSSAVEPLHAIELPSDIQNPRHALMTSTGNFVILHDLTNEGSKPEIRISELTRHDLDVLHSFTPLNKEQCLGVPYQLLLDSDDRVLVADHWNSRMILLNSDLTWNQSCTIKHKSDEKQRPKSIHYDEKNRQLIVAGNVSLLKGGVNVYALGWKTKTDAVSE